MRAVDIIVKKRNGEHLLQDEIDFLISHYMNGDIPEYQISAFLMAAFFKGMDFDETFFMTDAMLRSGVRLDFSRIPGFKVDKHSTGGVGDKVSLIVAPIAASCGCKIPMMSGRGLGHTGGTLDKLESIPGYTVFLDKNQIDKIINDCSFVMMGQTAEMVPADKRLYALRDVTGTVESIPLITSSIMSKKIAEGTDGLVLDLKCGCGAFMKNIEDARRLAEFIKGVADRAVMRMKILITDMNEPLGNAIGNYNEVLESAEVLKGEGESRLAALSHRIAGWMIVLAGKAATIEEGMELSRNAVSSGKAFEYFVENVKNQGGDPDYVILPRKRYYYSTVLTASVSGFIESIDAYQIGLASMQIGGGRKTTDDQIDHYAGITLHKHVGDHVDKDEPVMTLYWNGGDAETAISLCRNAVKYTDLAVKPNSIIFEEIG